LQPPFGRSRVTKETSSAEVVYGPIGIIRSPWPTPAGAPIQAASAAGAEGALEVHAAFAGGLADLDGFSHAIVLWHMHLVRGHELNVVPFLDDRPHGIFATRSPKRPHPIGLSIYRVLRVEERRVVVAGVDAVDGSPLLDVKPYVPAFDAPPADRIGWFAGRLANVGSARADGRFD
jgi:tRNA-Thr(GGU) m(6)t(6)A37 methyltransferase TsaA